MRPSKNMSQLTALPINPITSYSPLSGTGQNGAGILDFIGKIGRTIGNANNFLRNGKYISRGSKFIGNVTGNDSLVRFGNAAETYGYGDGRSSVKNAPRKNGRKGGLAKARKTRKRK